MEAGSKIPLVQAGKKKLVFAQEGGMPFNSPFHSGLPLDDPGVPALQEQFLGEGAHRDTAGKGS